MNVAMKTLLLLIIPFLTSCAGAPIRYDWKLVAEPSLTYTWNKVSIEGVQSICGGEYKQFAGCAVQNFHTKRCTVTSVYGHEESRWLNDGEGQLSHYEHELKHCMGWRH